MKPTNAMRELIKIDIKNGMSMANLTKKYEVKKNIIRDIQAEIDGRHSISQSVAPSESEIITEVAVTKDETIKEAVTVNNYINDNFNILVEMIEKYKSENQIYKDGLTVRLPKEGTGDYKTSVRVNKIVMDQFRKFCEKNNEFTQKELLSMALLEYIEKYDNK